MAALSSLTESHTKTIRLTYQELLELADKLDEEKKKKSPKRKSKENPEDKGTESSVWLNKDESFVVDNKDEKEEGTPKKKIDSKKTEKRTREEKKSSKKKGEDKKKHRDRSHGDEKHSILAEEVKLQETKNEGDEASKDSYKKTKIHPTDTPNIDFENSLKDKEEKKRHRKRSPRLKEDSGEETADFEDRVAKLQLNDPEGDDEVTTDALADPLRKPNKNSCKKKVKSNEEHDKNHSKSKRKDKKKSDSPDQTIKKDSNENEGTEKEKKKRKKEKRKKDDNTLEDEHEKHGILKSPTKLKTSHVHVSFSEDVLDSHSDERNVNASKSEERGIIRIPEGMDIHKDDQNMAGSMEESFEELTAGDDYHHEAYDGNNYNDYYHKENQSVSKIKEEAEDKQHDKGVQSHEDHEEKKLNMEKRLKALNRQRAHKLIKECHQTENSLSNLLSKGITDKASIQKVCMLSKEIQDFYQGVMMLDLGFAHQHDIDQILWKNAFYQVIETFRKYGKLFLGYSSQKNVMSPEEINDELHQFLETASYFYSDILEGLQKMYSFEVEDIVNQPRKAEMLGRNAKLALLSCHHILIFLGDIQRYKEQLQMSKGINWGTVRNWYLKASKLAPKNGKPYNQLAVIAVYANRKLDAVYYYVRSLCVSSPILTAKEKLTTIFHEIQRKANQVQQEEEMQRIQQEQQRAAQDRRDTSRRRGRNVFREAAREVGLVTEKEPAHGRHEIWVFMRQGKYRRMVLTEEGKLQQVDATGNPITKERHQDNNHRDPMPESPKISLQEVNKKFMLHFLCAHGLLYTRIGMERLPNLHVQLMGELHTLLGFPQCSSVSCISLLQMSAINMFAIDHTAPRENQETFVRVGTPQDQALTLAMDMLISILNACTDLLMKLKPREEGANNHHDDYAATLRQFIPAVKVWFDWLTTHQDLWQASSIGTCRTLWESIAQLSNLFIQQHELPKLEEDENGEVLVTLNEDELLAGFKPLADAKKCSRTINNPQQKDLVEDHLHVVAVEDFCKLMSSMPNPILEYCQEIGQYTAVITSIPSPEPQDSSSVAAVHMDIEHPSADQQESYESDDVIIESVLEDVESGDEADKGFRELKAKKDKLAKELEDHKEKHSKARAVVHENVSRPHLISENYPTFLVPDTNCFIDQLSGLQAIVLSEDFTLVVPLVVINELDGLKKDLMIDKYEDFSHAQMVMENARAAIDFLEDQFSLRSPHVKAVTSKGTVMDTIAFRSEDATARTGNNDDVILSCCLHYCQEDFVNRLATADQPITIRRKVVLLTDDRNLRLKAYTRNVPVLTVPQFRQMARL